MGQSSQLGLIEAAEIDIDVGGDGLQRDLVQLGNPLDSAVAKIKMQGGIDRA